MKPDISEFSYGYALTEGLIRWVGTPLTAAPVFPSLIEEGRPGGGYDVRLDHPGIPLFLQFKLSDYMRSRNAVEFRYYLFSLPFYRMYLRPRRQSDQHALLLDLENAGNDVFYVAPAFHRVSELNRAYISQNVLSDSIFVAPSAIGALPDDDKHHVSFRLNDRVFLLSTPVEIKAITSEDLAKHIFTQLQEKHQSGVASMDSLVSLGQEMLALLKERLWDQRDLMAGLEAFSDLSPIQRVAYLARMYYGCEMFMVREKGRR
jgi:hypothetical protein